MDEDMSENMNDGNVIVCKLMGMGHDHLCRNFSEKKCMLCQLRNNYNNTYSWIINNVDVNYEKRPGFEGLFKLLTPAKGLSAEQKKYVNSKLVDLYAIKELIQEIEDEKYN